MDKILKFAFDKSSSEIFGCVRRPIATVYFWSYKINAWVGIVMIIDTGADYTLLPRFYASELGINLKRDCSIHWTGGIGGKEKVYLLRCTQIKIGRWKRSIPVGFLDRDNIPPLLGRQEFLETFKVILFNHHTFFSQDK